MVLDYASTGDLNFLRMLTGTEIISKEIKTNYNLLTISTPDLLLECTSSWYAWSRNLDKCIGCNYCIILQLEYLERKKVNIGVHPRDILKHVKEQNLEVFTNFKRTKLKKHETSFSEYEQVRVKKPCFLHRYPSLHEAPVYSDKPLVINK